MSSADDLLALIASGNVNAVHELLELDPSLAKTRDSAGVSAICLAAYRNRRRIAEELAKCRDDLDIFEASSLGDIARARHLIAQDRTLANQTSPDGFGPLGLASFFGHPDLVDFLISSGANPNVASNNNMKVCPLHSAVAVGDQSLAPRMAIALLRAGADVNAKQNSGFTPLQEAAINGNAELIGILLEHGADESARNDAGKTAADLAEEKGHHEAARRLRP